MSVDVILGRLDGVHRSGSGWRARCPAHEGRSDTSLVVTEGDGKVMLHCFAECATGAIVDALGLTMCDLFDDVPALSGHDWEAERVLAQNNAAAEAQSLWTRARDVSLQHPYLLKKKIAGCGARLLDSQLIVPMRMDRHLFNVQRIYADGRKRFLKGGRTKGCYFAIGGYGDRMWIAEGYATGVSVAIATANPVAVAFSAGNLAAVAAQLRTKSDSLHIASDNDKAGMEKAEAVLREGLADDMVWPDNYNDWNDMAVAEGPEAVGEELK